MGGPPDADFATWGNSDYMKSRRPKLRGLRPGGDGLWYPVQLSTPENITVWHQGLDVYRTVVIMLQIYHSAIVDEFRGNLAYNHSLFGPTCWHIIARLDARARSQHIERARRVAPRAHREGKNHGYTEDNPWPAALRVLIDDTTYWREHVVLPCTLVAANAAAHTRLVYERDADSTTATSSTSVGVPAPPPPAVVEALAETRGKNRQDKQDLSEKGGKGHYVKNRKGQELCKDYGSRKRTSTGQNNKCGRNSERVRQCAICLQIHPTCEHGKQNK